MLFGFSLFLVRHLDNVTVHELLRDVKFGDLRSKHSKQILFILGFKFTRDA